MENGLILMETLPIATQEKRTGEVTVVQHTKSRTIRSAAQANHLLSNKYYYNYICDIDIDKWWDSVSVYSIDTFQDEYEWVNQLDILRPLSFRLHVARADSSMTYKFPCPMHIGCPKVWKTKQGLRIEQRMSISKRLEDQNIYLPSFSIDCESIRHTQIKFRSLPKYYREQLLDIHGLSASVRPGFIKFADFLNSSKTSPPWTRAEIYSLRRDPRTKRIVPTKQIWKPELM